MDHLFYCEIFEDISILGYLGFLVGITCLFMSPSVLMLS